ncbi:hypothetical protein SMC26_37840 [Actinomadura fulvescens]|uniref:Secreted protein n=1 Tax=Actinomadura fulvescens TaxID=46160 RepID=A0ABN3QX80_9ACTN
MKSVVRAAATIAVGCALLPVTAAPSQAAPSQAAPSVRADCLTASEAHAFGRGEISVCPQGDGTYRAVGWVEDLLPGDGAFSGPDGGCVTWYLYAAKPWPETFTTMACPHFSGPAKVQINEVVKPTAPLTKAVLGTYWA